MIQITIRIFPLNKRASFSSKTVEINKENPTLKDLIIIEKSVQFETHKFCRGTEFLKIDSMIFDKEVINIIPL
jgi:hypothetical protein